MATPTRQTDDIVTDHHAYALASQLGRVCDYRPALAHDCLVGRVASSERRRLRVPFGPNPAPRRAPGPNPPLPVSRIFGSLGRRRRALRHCRSRPEAAPIAEPSAKTCFMSRRNFTVAQLTMTGSPGRSSRRRSRPIWPRTSSTATRAVTSSRRSCRAPPPPSRISHVRRLSGARPAQTAEPTGRAAHITRTAEPFARQPPRIGAG
jgi:hypothetical protein